MLYPFRIHEPTTVLEASRLLEQYGRDDAAIYAGGTELLLLMKENLARYTHLINIKTIPGLDAITYDAPQRCLHIGALTTHRALVVAPLVQQHAPLVAAMEAQVANVRVRAIGTIGGNLCFAEPHSDPATLLLAWEATLELRSSGEERTMPVGDFFLGLLETARRPEEILTGIWLPLPPSDSGCAYEKFGKHERPTASLAAVLRVHDGLITEARMAVGSVGPMPARVPEAEALLRGQPPDEAALLAAAARAAREVDVMDDLYGSIEYKRQLVQVLAVRALRAAGRAGRDAHAN